MSFQKEKNGLSICQNIGLTAVLQNTVNKIETVAEKKLCNFHCINEDLKVHSILGYFVAPCKKFNHA